MASRSNYRNKSYLSAWLSEVIMQMTPAPSPSSPPIPPPRTPSSRPPAPTQPAPRSRPTPYASPPPPRRTLDRLRDPQQIGAVLNGLSGEALLVLRLLCEIPERNPFEFLIEEGRLLLGAERTQATLEDLLGRGVLERDRHGRPSLPEDVCQRLRLWLPTLDEPVMLADAPPGGPGGGPGGGNDGLAVAQEQHRGLAVVLLALWTLRPKVTNDGRVFKKDRERLEELLGADYPLEQGLSFLNDCGVRVMDGVLRVPAVVAERLGQMPPARVLGWSLLHRFSHYGQGRVMLDFLRGLPRGAYYRRAALLRMFRLSRLRGPFWITDPVSLQRSAEEELKRLLEAPGVEVRRGGGEVYVRLSPLLYDRDAPAAAGAPGRIHLQPSFEVLVPPETPVPVLLSIGRVAELRRVDQVLTLQVTRQSIVRAVEQGLSVEQILKSLEDAVHAGVPQNVAASIKSWAGQAGQAQFVDGLLLIIRADAEPLVQGDPELSGVLERVAAGVYLVPERSATVVQRRLKAHGIIAREGVVRSSGPAPQVEDPIFCWEPPSGPSAPIGQRGELWDRVRAVHSALSREKRGAAVKPAGGHSAG